MNIAAQTATFTVEIASTEDDVLAAQRLRYAVFAIEFGADGVGFDHDACHEQDRFDSHADHLVLKDTARPTGDQIVGVYRLLRSCHAVAAGQFYSASEFDLNPLVQSGKSVLEMSRSCLHPDYRGGTALLHLWKGLQAYVFENEIDIVFGVASFPGASATDHVAALALLYQDYLAPDHLRPKPIGAGAVPSKTYADQAFDRREAMIAMPALIKAYLRMGGVVGDGAFVDAAFGTTDVCMILETAQLNARQRAFLGAMQDG